MRPFPDQDRLFTALSALYADMPALADFAPLPSDMAPQPFAPHHRDASDQFQNDAGLLHSAGFSAITSLLLQNAQRLHWREVYTPSNQPHQEISTAFMARLGCTALIGDRAPFCSAQLHLFVVYMPAGLIYPWHRHLAEELYLILAGEAVFCRTNHADITAKEGDIILHESQQPHMMYTTTKPMLSLAVWRNHLSQPAQLMPAPY